MSGIVEPTPTPRRISSRRLMLGLVAAGLLAGIVGLIAIVLLTRQSVPLLTETKLAEAEKRWAEQGPPSYNIDITLGGSQRGQIHVEVRNDEVTKMTRDGRSPQQRRTWEYWTVPSQFDTIRQDMRLAANPERPFGVASSDQVVLRAKFDPEYGYPLEYRRSVSGASYDVEWRIDHFEVVK